MELTSLLAKLLGAFSIIMAFSMLSQRRMVVKIFEEVFSHRGLAYMLGLVEVIAGLLLVLKHNIWVGTLATVITVLGWLILLEGMLYIFAKQSFLRRIIHRLHSVKFYYILSLVYLLLGLWLLVAGTGVLGL